MLEGCCVGLKGPSRAAMACSALEQEHRNYRDLQGNCLTRFTGLLDPDQVAGEVDE